MKLRLINKSLLTPISSPESPSLLKYTQPNLMIVYMRKENKLLHFKRAPTKRSAHLGELKVIIISLKARGSLKSKRLKIVLKKRNLRKRIKLTLYWLKRAQSLKVKRNCRQRENKSKRLRRMRGVKWSGRLGRRRRKLKKSVQLESLVKYLRQRKQVKMSRKLKFTVLV